MGTAIPDVENMISLSKLFSVSIDYLVNDTIETEFDESVTEATTAVFKKTLKYILARVAIMFCIILVAIIVGVVTDSFFSMILFLSTVGFLGLVYFIVRLMISVVSNKN